MGLEFEVDLVELIRAGAEVLCLDTTERLQVLLEASEQLKHRRAESAGSRLYDSIEKALVDAGLCPNCAETVDIRAVPHVVPYGNTVAIQNMNVKVCPACGEI